MKVIASALVAILLVVAFYICHVYGLSLWLVILSSIAFYFIGLILLLFPYTLVVFPIVLILTSVAIVFINYEIYWMPAVYSGLGISGLVLLTQYLIWMRGSNDG